VLGVQSIALAPNCEGAIPAFNTATTTLAIQKTYLDHVVHSPQTLTTVAPAAFSRWPSMHLQ